MCISYPPSFVQTMRLMKILCNVNHNHARMTEIYQLSTVCLCMYFRTIACSPKICLNGTIHCVPLKGKCFLLNNFDKNRLVDKTHGLFD